MMRTMKLLYHYRVASNCFLLLLLLGCAGQPSWPAPAVDRNTTCVAAAAEQLDGRCLDGDDGQASLEAILGSYAACLGTVGQRPLNVLAPTSFQSWMNSTASQYTQLSGQPVNVTYMDFFAIPLNIVRQRAASGNPTAAPGASGSTVDTTAGSSSSSSNALALAGTGGIQHDLYILDGGSLPWLARSGLLLQLDSYIAYDAGLAWDDVSPLWKAYGKLANVTYGMPIDSDCYLLYYRRDMFDRYGLRAPTTWQQLADMAGAWEAMWVSGNLTTGGGASTGGTGRSSAQVPRYGLCLNDARVCQNSYLLSAILASITQPEGPMQGWFLDLEAPAEQAGRLVNGTALQAALELFSSLMRHSPKGLVCQQTLQLFTNGSCLMTINWGRQFKALQSGTAAQGRAGVAVLPGSTIVYDRSTGQLVPASPRNCRDAVQIDSAGVGTGTGGAGGQWACRAPVLVYGGTYGAIAPRGPTYQNMAYWFLSYMMGKVPLLEGLLDPTSPLEPVRSSMLAPNAYDLLVGLGSYAGAASYDPGDARAYLTALQQTFASPNAAQDINAPANAMLRLHLDMAALSYMGGVPAAAVGDQLLRSWLSEWGMVGYDIAAVQALLRAAQHDTAAAPAANDTAGPPQPRSSKVPGWGIAVAAVGGVLVAALLLGGACWARWRLALRRGLRRIAPPMCGDETTLVVTDIQDSTKLWESCHDADVMDYSITQHHSLARKLILKYGGYESATEGDSFIIAFHAPHDAVCFCAALQQELLWLPWPEDLLALEGCAPMWMCKMEPEVASRRRMPSLPVQTPLSRFVSTPHAASPLHGAGNASPGVGGGGSGYRTPNESDPGNGSPFEGGGGEATVGLAAAALAPGSAPGTPYHPTPGSGTDGHGVGHLQGQGSASSPQRSPSQVHRGRVAGSVGGGALGASPRQLSFLGRSAARHAGSPLAAGAAAARLDRSITLPPPRGEPLLPPAAVAALPPAASSRVAGESGSGERDSAASGGRFSVGSRTTTLQQAGAEGVVQAAASAVGSSAMLQPLEQQQQQRVWQSYDGRVPTFTGFDAMGPGPGASMSGAAVSNNGGPAGLGAAAAASVLHMRGPEAPAWTMGLSGVHEEEGSGRLLDDTTPLSPASISATNNGAGSGAMATVSEFKSSVSSMAHEDEGPHSALSIHRDGSHVEYPPRGRHGAHVHNHGPVSPGGGGSGRPSALGPVAEGLSRVEHVSRPQHGTRASARRASVTFDIGRGGGDGGGGGNGSSSDGAASVSGGGSSRNSSRGLPQGVGSPHISSAGHSDDGGTFQSPTHPQYSRVGPGGAPRGPRHRSDGPPPYTHGRRSMPSGGPPPPPPVDSLRRRSDASTLPGPSDPAQAPIWYGGPHATALPRPASAHGGESTLRPSPLSRASSRGGTTSCGGASATTASGASHGGHQRIPRSAAPHAPGTPTSPQSPTSPVDRDRQASSPLPTISLPPPVPMAPAADYPTPFAAFMAPGPSGHEESPSAQEPLVQALSKRHTSDSLTSPPAATRAAAAHLCSSNAGPALYRASIASCVALKAGRSNDGGTGGDDLDAALQVPAVRHSSIVFPVNRPAVDHVQGSALSVAAAHPIPMATPNTPFSPTAAAAAAASGGGPSHAPRSMLHASVSRGLFGLMSLPSPRGPGGGGGGLLGLGGSSHAQLAVDSRAASMASMMRLASQHNLQSVGDSLCTRWRVVDPGEPGAQLVFRGLRVRMGVHSGLKSEADVQLNRAANRMQYTGLGLQMAKAVCDCAHGGQVLMTEAAFTQLAVEGLKERVMVLHMGEHSMKEGLPPTSIYCGCPRSLQGRLPQLRTVRSKAQHSLGVLDAPAGSVCVVFMHVVGTVSLMDWRPELAHEALAMFRDHVTTELIKHQGYLVEAVDGLVLASFSSPASGLRWASRCERDMAQLPWPPELLQHEACEELVMPRRDPVTGVEEELLIFKGLRIKAGIDVGRLRGEINCITGRMSYRGRAMNRAARIVAAAGSGQLLASAEAWRAGSTQQAARLAGLSAVSLGQFALKGVSEAIEVYRIKTSAAAASKRATTVLSGRLDPLDTDDMPIADPLLALQHHAALSHAGTLGASPSTLPSPSAAAAGAGAGVITVGAASAQSTPTRRRSQRMAGGRAAGAGGEGGRAGGLVAGVGGRLGALGFAGRSSSVTVPVVQPQVERMRSLGASGMVAALRRGESVTAAGGGWRRALSRQMSKNLSRRSRLSSRQSSMGGQFSPLAANTMLSAARGSLDGRLELGLLALPAPPPPSGINALQPEAHHPQPLQPEAGPPISPAPTAAAQPGPSNPAALAQLLSTNVSHINTHTSASTISQPGYTTSHGAALGTGLLFHGSGAHPRTARTSRTSRASATTDMGDAADQRSSNARSSNARSSNASIKSQPLLHQSVSSPIPRPAPAAAGGGSGAANAAAAAPTPRLMGGHGLVRHLSTLIRSAGNALYGGGHQSHTAAGTVWGSSGLPSSPMGTAGHLSPTSVVAMSVAGVHADTAFESPPAGGGGVREQYRAFRVTSDRPSREGAAAARAAAGGSGGDGSRAPHFLGSPLQLASPGAPLARGGGGGGGGGGGVLLDTLQTRLRAATGSIFRGGSFSGGHTLRLRPEDLHASEYGDRQSRRARSPPNRRTVSTLTGNGFMFVGGGDTAVGSAAGGAAAVGGGGLFLGGGGYRHRSAAVEHLRSPMLAAEGALGVEGGGGGRRQGRRDRERAERERELEWERERWASAEGRANDSFVIVVGGENGESDGDEEEEEGDVELAGRRLRGAPPPRVRVPRRGSAEAAAAAARRRSAGAVAVAPLASLGYPGSPGRSGGSVTMAGRAPTATGGGGGWRSAEWERGAVGGGGGRGLSAGQVAALVEAGGAGEDGGGEQGGNASPRPPSLSHPQTFFP